MGSATVTAAIKWLGSEEEKSLILGVGEPEIQAYTEAPYFDSFNRLYAWSVGSTSYLAPSLGPIITDLDALVRMVVRQ